MLDFPIVAQALFVAFAGVCLGSFATAMIYRIPRGISWVSNTKAQHNSEKIARSACPSCKHTLAARDLIPVLSWLMSAGKCRHCNAPIGARYIMIELVSALACLGAYAALGWSLGLIVMMVSIPFLMALLVIDLDHMILPNQLIVILVIIGIVMHGSLIVAGAGTVPAFLLTYALGALVYGGFIWGVSKIVSTILKKPSLGFGDVKFFALAGLWLGLPMLPYFCLLGGCTGVVVAAIYRKNQGNGAFPFGPALIISFYMLSLLKHSSFLQNIL